MINIEKGRYWDLPWSLVSGCTPCSPGCDHCWSAAMEKRFRPGVTIDEDSGKFTGKIIIHPERLGIPLKRRKPTVYAVWNDLFHEAVDFDFQADAFSVMGRCTKHTFLVLTKRPQIMVEFMDGYKRAGVTLPNVWNGLTVCNQEEADEKIPIFLQVPGNKYLSIEPMLGPVDLANYLYDHYWHRANSVRPTGNPREIDAVVLGGETGPGARPMHPDWVRSVRDQCEAAGVPFFLKSMGEWGFLPKTVISATPVPNKTPPWGWYSIQPWPDGWSVRVGKKNVGRLLDGLTHDDLPWSVR